MSHYVQAFIGARQLLEPIRNAYGVSRVVDLTPRLALLPLLPELYDAIPGDLGASEPGFQYLTPKIVNLLKRSSEFGSVGYLETEYFGGTGTQGAVLASLGEIVFGPKIASNSINEMLARMGVIVTQARDEFDAIGLGRFRDNPDWIDQPGAPMTRESATMTGSLISWIHSFRRKP